MSADAALAFENRSEAQNASPPKALELRPLRRALAAVLVWYDAFDEAQKMAIQSQSRRPRLRE
jgi:hypothetical protein